MPLYLKRNTNTEKKRSTEKTVSPLKLVNFTDTDVLPCLGMDTNIKDAKNSMSAWPSRVIHT